MIRETESCEIIETTDVMSSCPDVIPMERVLEDIRLDSQSVPQVFLEETVVPYGGE